MTDRGRDEQVFTGLIESGRIRALEYRCQRWERSVALSFPLLFATSTHTPDYSGMETNGPKAPARPREDEQLRRHQQALTEKITKHFTPIATWQKNWYDRVKDPTDLFTIGEVVKIGYEISKHKRALLEGENPLHDTFPFDWKVNPVPADHLYYVQFLFPLTTKFKGNAIGAWTASDAVHIPSYNIEEASDIRRDEAGNPVTVFSFIVTVFERGWGHATDPMEVSTIYFHKTHVNQSPPTGYAIHRNRDAVHVINTNSPRPRAKRPRVEVFGDRDRYDDQDVEMHD